MITNNGTKITVLGFIGGVLLFGAFMAAISMAVIVLSFAMGN